MILVTGAGGFIGSHLVEALLEAGYAAKDIRLLLWKDESLDNLPKEKFDIVRGDVRNIRDVLKAMKGVKTVYHLAARTDFAGKKLDDYFAPNVLGTQNILDAGRIHGLKRIIFYSSMAVHGIPAEVGPIAGWDERYAPQKPCFTNPYGHSKWIAEQRIKKAHRDFGVEYVIIRPTTVYGPRAAGPTVALIKTIQAGYYFQIGSGENQMEYVHVRDLVRGTIKAAQSSVRSGIVMMSGPIPVPFRQVVQAVYRAVGKDTPKWFIPGFLMQFLSWPLGIVKNFFGIAVPLYPQRVNTLLSTYWFDTRKARRLYGYTPTIGIQEGIAETVTWIQEQAAV